MSNISAWEKRASCAELLVLSGLRAEVVGHLDEALSSPIAAMANKASRVRVDPCTEGAKLDTSAGCEGAKLGGIGSLSRGIGPDGLYHDGTCYDLLVGYGVEDTGESM